MKKSIITIVAFMLFALAGFAQEKYEYATVTYAGGTKEPVIYVSKENNVLEKIEVQKNGTDLNIYLNSTPLLNYVKEMQKEGWETENSSYNGNGLWYFIMKRKVK